MFYHVSPLVLKSTLSKYGSLLLLKRRFLCSSHPLKQLLEKYHFKPQAFNGPELVVTKRWLSSLSGVRQSSIVKECPKELPEDASKSSSINLNEISLSPPVITVPLDVSLPQDKPKSDPHDFYYEQKIEPHQLSKHYKSLSKFKLTSLVVATTVTGYFLAPLPLDPNTLLFTVLGTGLTSCSANTLNQFLEMPYDSQMARTKNRVLVRGILTPLHSALFAGATGILGVSTLALGVNGLTAALGAANLVLYAGVYTPLKRCSIVNTWVGAIVGAIPPIMGWTACTGSLDLGSLVLGAILFSWQFPHFNALSWNLRADYSRAGYRMMSVTHPDLCRRTALRHTVALTAVCGAAPLTGLVGWDFFLLSLPLNLLFTSYAWDFYTDPSSSTSRHLFHFSLFHLLILVILLTGCAKVPPYLHGLREKLGLVPPNKDKGYPD